MGNRSQNGIFSAPSGSSEALTQNPTQVYTERLTPRKIFFRMSG